MDDGYQEKIESLKAKIKDLEMHARVATKAQEGTKRQTKTIEKHTKKIIKHEISHSNHINHPEIVLNENDFRPVNTQSIGISKVNLSKKAIAEKKAVNTSKKSAKSSTKSIKPLSRSVKSSTKSVKKAHNNSKSRKTKSKSTSKAKTHRTVSKSKMDDIQKHKEELKKIKEKLLRLEQKRKRATLRPTVSFKNNISGLNNNIQALLDLLTETHDEVKDGVIEADKHIIEKLDLLLNQNEKIAQGILTLADMIKNKTETQSTEISHEIHETHGTENYGDQSSFDPFGSGNANESQGIIDSNDLNAANDSNNLIDSNESYGGFASQGDNNESYPNQMNAGVNSDRVDNIPNNTDENNMNYSDENNMNFKPNDNLNNSSELMNNDSNPQQAKFPNNPNQYNPYLNNQDMNRPRDPININVVQGVSLDPNHFNSRPQSGFNTPFSNSNRDGNPVNDNNNELDFNNESSENNDPNEFNNDSNNMNIDNNENSEGNLNNPSDESYEFNPNKKIQNHTVNGDLFSPPPDDSIKPIQQARMPNEQIVVENNRFNNYQDKFGMPPNDQVNIQAEAPPGVDPLDAPPLPNEGSPSFLDLNPPGKRYSEPTDFNPNMDRGLNVNMNRPNEPFESRDNNFQFRGSSNMNNNDARGFPNNYNNPNSGLANNLKPIQPNTAPIPPIIPPNMGQRNDNKLQSKSLYNDNQ